MDLIELKKLHDKAYNSGQVTRERASDDMVFYFVTQWDDNILSESQLAYRGEFNILKKAGRQIISDLAANPIQVDFVPREETRDDAAELVDGKYRKDGNHNESLEAFENGKQEAVVCGVGAWELYTKYVSNRAGDKNQVIRRRPIFEANNNVFWDPNAKYLDKSDAKYVSVLTAYSEDGYKDLVEELTGEEIDNISEGSFKHPEQSFTFPWIGGQAKKIYVVSFYQRVKVKEKILTMTDPFGQTIDLTEASLDKIMDEMLDAGYEIESERKISRYQIKKYVASGEKILSTDIIPGEHLPIVPIYGEHAYIEGEVHYEGITRLAKDPQRLRNFQLSYLADIVSQSPRRQPIFFPEQIRGFEKMYSTSGIDNRFAYLLQNMKSASGEPLPIGPVAEMPDQQIPQALAMSIEVSRQAVEDVANPGVPQDIADPDLSGKAVLALQSRMDMQAMIYQEHYKHGKRRDAEIYASMAPEIYDVPRKTKIELPDGTKKDVEVMQAIIDEQTGDVVYLNDLRNATFDVYSKISSSFSSQKEQTISQLQEMMLTMDPNDPVRKALQLKLLMLMDGVAFDDIREFANKQLVLMGIKKPTTPEEQQLLQDSQNNQNKEDPAMVLAKAEELKGQADIMQEKREGIKMQLDDENKKSDQHIDIFKATTDRMKVQIEAQKAGATINKTDVDTVGSRLDNQAKIIDMISPDKEEASGEKSTELVKDNVQPVDFSQASNEELFRTLVGG